MRDVREVGIATNPMAPLLPGVPLSPIIAPYPLNTNRITITVWRRSRVRMVGASGGGNGFILLGSPAGAGRA